VYSRVHCRFCYQIDGRMMFRRNSQRDTLPTTSYNSSGGVGGLPLGGGGSGALDGSGRSIKMDAPVVKAWKKASGYTRWTYYFLGFTLFTIFYGFRTLRYWNASIWLTCHQQECTLEITPPGTRTMTVIFPRTQLQSAQPIKTDKDGNFIEIDRDKYEPPPRKGQKKTKKYSSNSRGPDSDGRYKTYRINLLKESPKGDDKDNVIDSDFSEVKKYLNEEDDGMYSLHFRQFSLTQTRLRIRSNINKVESYVKKRRQKLLIKESAILPWQGILFLVFGLVGLLLTILIGQFWDEAPRKQGGPGARRQSSSYRRSSSSRRMPSRRSSGYQSRKKY